MDNVFSRTYSTFTTVGTCLLPSTHFVRLKEVKLKGKKQGTCASEGEVEGVLLFGSVNYEALLFLFDLPVPQKTPNHIAREF